MSDMTNVGRRGVKVQPARLAFPQHPQMQPGREFVPAPPVRNSRHADAEHLGDSLVAPQGIDDFGNLHGPKVLQHR